MRGSPRRLIVNADDFGLSPGVNRGVIEAHERGIVTSASLMVRWPAAVEAAAYARAHPELSVGLHLDFAEWIVHKGAWEPLYEVIDEEDTRAVEAEVARQLEAFRRLVGREPTHLDSHQHAHFEEPAHTIVRTRAGELGVPVRNFGPVRYRGDFYGQGPDGTRHPDLITVGHLVEILGSLPNGTTELGCHPGYPDGFESNYVKERATEVHVLCDPRVRDAIAENEIELLSFASLAAARPAPRGSKEASATYYWFDEAPSTDALAAVLAQVLDDERVRIVERSMHHYASSFLGEIVRCRTADGRKLSLFCKYGAGPAPPERGVRGGVRYEAEVYRSILLPMHLSAPHFYGAHEDAETGLTWLLLGLVEGQRVSLERELVAAGRWLGAFHACGEQPASRAEVGFLARYDADLLAGFARRTREFTRPGGRRYSWLPRICECFEELLPALIEEPVIIHGEYYRHNILYRRGKVFPVDWESAALGSGEIDLAHLVEAWPTRTVASTLLAYREARWPAGAPPEFEHRMDVARLYVHFRWLGDREEWTLEDESEWRFTDLRSLAERQGIL